MPNSMKLVTILVLLPVVGCVPEPPPVSGDDPGFGLLLNQTVTPGELPLKARPHVVLLDRTELLNETAAWWNTSVCEGETSCVYEIYDPGTDYPTVSGNPRQILISRDYIPDGDPITVMISYEGSQLPTDTPPLVHSCYAAINVNLDETDEEAYRASFRWVFGACLGLAPDPAGSGSVMAWPPEPGGVLTEHDRELLQPFTN